MRWEFPANLAVPGVPGEPGVVLHRLARSDAGAIATWCDPESLRYLSKHPSTWDEAGIAALLDELLAMPASVFYAVVVDGAVAGVTAYLDIGEHHRRLEIGWTVYGAGARSSGVNSRVKRAMIDHAFGLGAVRVCMTTDSRNTRSQRAIEKLGAVYEGTMRQYGRMPDGYQRDVRVYSIVRGEWPAAGTTVGARARAEFERFDYGATFNARYRGAYSMFESHLRRVMAEAARDAGGGPVRVLDLGCGDGWTASVLAEVTGGRYAGVDTSENALRTLRSRFDARSALAVATFHAGAERVLDESFATEVQAFLGGRADVLICNTALHQIRKAHADVLGALEAACGLVRPGGRVIVGDYWYPTELSDAEVEASREWIRAQSGQTPTVREGFVSPEDASAAMTRAWVRVSDAGRVAANESIALRYWLLTGERDG